VVDGKLSIPLVPTNENKYVPGTFEIYVSGDANFQFRPDPLAVVEATEDQKAVEQLVVQAGEELKKAQARKGEIAKSSLTADEKAAQTAAADAEIAKAQERSNAAAEANKRAAEILKQANERNKPRDLKLLGYSRPVTLKIAAAPVRFKQAPPVIEVAKGAAAELSVEIERLYGFADTVELSMVPPKDLKGFEPKPVSVAKDQGAGRMGLRANPDAPDGTHAFDLLAKMNFNGVNCELRQPIQVRVVAAIQPPEASQPPGGETPPPPPAK
jgi:hypothetical protein